MAYTRTTNGPVSTAAGSGAGPSGSPSHQVAVRWLSRWPYATGSVVAVAIWFATSAVLAEVIPAAPPPFGMVGLLIGVTIGTWLAGLDGARGWVVVPVITLALGWILGGAIVAVSDLRLP
jgi:hypothetical protein